MCSADILSECSQENNIFNAFSSTGEFLFAFPKDIIAAILYLAPFPDCYLSQHAVNDARLAELPAVVFLSSSKLSTLYIYCLKSPTNTLPPLH
jgi:hypothetical protein